MADAEYSGEIDVQISAESLAAMSGVITDALSKAQKPVMDSLTRLMKDMARKQSDEFRKAAQRTRDLADASKAYAKSASAGDKATIGFVAQVKKLTDAIGVQVAAINSAASANRNASQITQRELISQRVALDRSEQLKLQILREGGKKAAIEAQAAGNLQLVAARESAQQRVQITRLAIETIGRLEKGLVTLLTGFGRTSVGALSKSFSAIGSLFSRQNREFTSGLSSTLTRRESILSRSFSRQEADLRATVSRQQRTIQQLNTSVSTGVLGAATGRGVGGGIFGGLAAGAGLAGLLTSGFQRFSDLERINKQFLALTGNISDANALLEEVRAFAKATPFDLVGVADLAKGFLAIGTAAEDVIPSVRTIADAVAFSGGTVDNLSRIQRAIGQVVSIGKLQGDELNQLAENLPGINIVQLLADQLTGGDTAALFAMKEAGEITSDAFLEAFVTGLSEDKRIVGASEDLAKTLSGRFANLKESFSDFGASLIGLVAGPLRLFATGLQTGFQSAADFINGEGLSEGLDLIRTALLSVAGGMLAIIAAKGAVEILGLLGKTAALIASPFGIILVTAGLIGGALAVLTQRSEPLRQALGELGDRFADIGSKIVDLFAPAVKGVGSLLDDVLIPAIDTAATWLAVHLVAGFDAAVNFITGTAIPAARGFASMLVDVIVPAARDAASFTVAAFDLISTKAQAVFAAVLPYIQPAIDGVVELGRAIGDAFTGNFSNLASGAGAAVGGIGSAIASIAGRIGELLEPVAKKVVDFLAGVFSGPNLARVANGFLDVVEFIGRILGSIVSDPRLIAASTAAAVMIALRFAKGFAEGVISNLPDLLAPIPGLLAKVLFDPDILLPALLGIFAITKILIPLRDSFTKLGQQGASGFASGLSSGLKSGGRNTVDFISTLFGGSDQAVATSTRRALAVVAGEVTAAQNRLRVLGSTTLVDPASLAKAKGEIRQLEEAFTPGQIAALQLRDRIAGIGQAATAARGIASGALKGLGTVFAGLNSAFLGAFSMTEGQGALGKIRSGLSQIKTAFISGAADLKQVAVQQFGSVGAAIGTAVTKGATAALAGLGGFIAGKAEGAAGGSGAISALTTGLMAGLATGSPVVGAVAGGAALIGAAIGRADAKAKAFRDSVSQLAGTLTDQLVGALEDGKTATLDVGDAFQALGDKGIIEALGPKTIANLNAASISLADVKAAAAGAGGDVAAFFDALALQAAPGDVVAGRKLLGDLGLGDVADLRDLFDLVNASISQATENAKFLAPEIEVSASAAAKFKSLFEGSGWALKGISFRDALQMSIDAATSSKPPAVIDNINAALDRSIGRLQAANSLLGELLNPQGDTALQGAIDSQILAASGLGARIQEGLASGTTSGGAVARDLQRQLSEAIGLGLQAGIENGFTDPAGLAFITRGILDAALEGVTDETLRQQLTDSFNTAIANAQPFIDEAAAAGQAAKYNQAFNDFLAANPLAVDVADVDLAAEIFANLSATTDLVGQELVNGVIQGIKNRKSAAVFEAEQLMISVTQAMKGIAEIRSPSRVTMEIGRFLGEGLAIGLEESTTSLGSVVANAIDDAISRARDAAAAGRGVLSEIAAGLFGAGAGSDASITFGAASLGVDNALAGLTSASSRFFDQFNSTVESIFAAARKQNEGKEALSAGELALLGSNPFALDTGSTTGVSNRASFIDALDAIANIGDQLLSAGTPFEQVAETVKTFRDSLIQQAEAAGFSGDALRQLVEQLGLSDTALAGLAEATSLAAAAMTDAQAAAAAQAAGQAQAANAQNVFSASQRMIQDGADNLFRSGASGQQIAQFLSGRGISGDILNEIAGASGDMLKSILTRAFGISTTAFIGANTANMFATQIGGSASSNFDPNGNPTSVFGPQNLQQFIERVVLPVLGPYSPSDAVVAQIQNSESIGGLMDLLEDLLGVSMPDFIDAANAVVDSVSAIDAYIAELNRAIPAMRLLPANAPVGGVTVRDTGEDTSAHRYLTFNNYIYLPTGDPQANALAVVNRQARAAMVPG